MDVVLEPCAGVDIGRDEVVACVRVRLGLEADLVCSGNGAFELKVVNAEHVKLLPGRTSDVLDAEWLAELLEHGLLGGSFVSPAAVRELRDLTPYRKRLIRTHAGVSQRIQKRATIRAAD